MWWVGGWGYLWEKHGLFRAKTPGRSCLKVSWILKQSNNGLERIATSSCSGMLSCRVLLWPSQRVSSVFFSPFPTLSRRYQPAFVYQKNTRIKSQCFINNSKDFLSFASNSSDLHVSPTNITSLKQLPPNSDLGQHQLDHWESCRDSSRKLRPFSWQNHAKSCKIYRCHVSILPIFRWYEVQGKHIVILTNPLESLPLLLRESRNVPELQSFSVLVSSAVYLRNEAIFVGPGRRPCW